MKVLCIGMQPRDVAAMGILVGLALKGASCAAAPHQAGRALPDADLYVIDLAGVGLHRWSVAAEAQLLQWLHGRSAVGLRLRDEEAWTQVQPARQSGQHLVWLTKPYGSEDMRGALQAAATRAPQAAASVAPVARATGTPSAALVRPAAPQPVASPAAPRAAAQASPQVAAAPARLAVMRPGGARDTASATPAAPQSLAVPAGEGARQLDAAHVAAIREAFPQIARHSLLARLVDCLASAHPQELRLTVQHSIVVHPREGWVATNAGMDAIERACRHEELASAVSTRDLDDAHAVQRATHLGAPRQPLDPFLWNLAARVVGEAAIAPARDARIALRGFPDYTRLQGVPDFFIQLAAICVRLPQTVSGLSAAFPGVDPGLIHRFMFLCATSGLGELSLVAAGAPGARRGAAPPRPRPRVEVRQGFFAALFNKLF